MSKLKQSLQREEMRKIWKSQNLLTMCIWYARVSLKLLWNLSSLPKVFILFFFLFFIIYLFPYFLEARKPYFLFSADLDGVFRSYLQFLSKLRSSLSEFTNSDAMQTEVKENIESSIQSIKNFSSWINCNPLAYEMSDNGPSVKKLLELEMPDSSKMAEGKIPLLYFII